MTASDLRIRPAAPEELPALVAIDDDACTLYAEAGLQVSLPPEHPFAIDEQRHWLASCKSGKAFFAVVDDALAGFIAMEDLDGVPYLDQLSVRRAFMRRGIGRALLARALEQSRPAGELWLNTYDHLPFNRPFYEAEGFRRVEESGWGTEMRAVVAAQREALPRPELRVVMVHRS